MGIQEELKALDLPRELIESIIKEKEFENDASGEYRPMPSVESDSDPDSMGWEGF
jgi:hypothetical protein